MDGYELRTSAGAGGREIDLLALDDEALLSMCEVDTYRSRGPGGQKRNKTESAVRLRLPGAGLIVVATESRSQHENRARALRRMRQAVALNLRRPVDPDDYRPGQVLGSCLSSQAKLRISRRDSRYNHVVREVLDVLAGCGMRLSEAAALIGVTTSHLSRFVRSDTKLLAQVNRQRRQAGMKTLR